MATKTEEELAAEVLEEMGIIGTGEDPSGTDDETKVINAYRIKFAELAAPPHECVYWARDEIPEAIFNVLRDLVINEVQGGFGNPLSPADKRTSELVII